MLDMVASVERVKMVQSILKVSPMLVKDSESISDMSMTSKFFEAMLCSFSVAEGNLAVLKWAQAKGYPKWESTYIWAAANSDLEVLKWAQTNGCT